MSNVSHLVAPEGARKIAVSAVIPCLNEEQTLAICIRKAQGSFAAMGLEGEIVVADNGSTDGSIEIAESLGARVVHERRKGYGAALMRGIYESRGEFIVMADADDSYDWSVLGEFVSKLRDGYDLVMGNRFLGGIRPGAMPNLHRYLGNPLLSWAARMAFRSPIGDFHCGMRAFTREAFERMQLRTPGMEFATEMVANAAHQQLRIAEIPVMLYPDKRNRPPHLRSFRDGWRHLRFILTYAPDHVFLVPGFSMLTLGLLLQGLLIRGPLTIAGLYMGIHFVSLGALLSLAGFNIIHLGVLAKTLMSQRYAGLASRTVELVRRRFSVEAGLIIGVLIMAAGAAVDASIAATWVTRYGIPMNSTVHLAFAATTAVVLGLNLICSSFLLNMILANDPRGDAGAPQR